jgi:5S rRNA maturation endonuclease (ribonuclease M5)
MFNTLKKELNIVEVVEYVTETPYKLTGESTYVPEDDICPSCGHKGCFRIKHEGENSEAFCKCFSENKVWDVISIVAQLKEISNVDAAKLLAKHYEVKLPNDYSPMQEVFNLAANYYHELLYTAGPYAELNGLTPLEYQKQIRGHTDEAINQFQIGWSDGGVGKFLESVGVSEEIIKESGLRNYKFKNLPDYLPAKTFIYPHLIRGRVSHFTFKDVLKQKAFQLPNKNRLNGHTYYNSDSIEKPGPVALVEGENDCISLVEAGWDSSVLCCNGSISGGQLDWLTINIKGRDVVTFFDSDNAGDGYRDKLAKLSKYFKSLTQIKVSGACKDIDEYLKKGGDLSALLESQDHSQHTSVEVDGEMIPDDASPIVVKNGAYHKVVYKDGNESLRMITNFTMELLNVYKRETENGIIREREVIITLSNGRKSDIVMVSSDAKTKLPTFKTLVANAIDGSFYGTEAELLLIWDKLYAIYPERTVNLIEQVGRIDHFHGWLFKDCFIADSGSIYEPDNRGVMWITDKEGVRPVSIIASESSQNDKQLGVPSIRSELSPDERKKMIGDVLKALAANLGDMSEALTLMGWCWATVHSETLFDKLQLFPHLQLWGGMGKGKSWIIKMFLDMFNMEGPGYTSISSLNSGVAFSRKMAYYTSLPMCIDEIRNDQLTLDWYSAFRSWYDRAGRSVGAKDFGVKTSYVRSTFMFGGEDLFGDPATRSRCIPVRLRKNNREMVKSFKILDDCRPDIHAIGYEWILGYKDIERSKLLEEVSVFEKFLVKAGVESRQARNWAVVGVFANKLCKEYCPEFNYMERLVKVASVNQEEQLEDSTLIQFWKDVEGMQSLERPMITSDHLRREGDHLYIWYSEIFRLFEKDSSYATKQKFSKNAVLSTIKEEDYYVGTDRKSIGMSGVVRRCLILDIPKSPEPVQTIVAFLDN